MGRVNVYPSELVGAIIVLASLLYTFQNCGSNTIPMHHACDQIVGYCWSDLSLFVTCFRDLHFGDWGVCFVVDDRIGVCFEPF